MKKNSKMNMTNTRRIYREYAINVRFNKQKVVVVGGGKIATRRIKTLLNYTEHIHVVSPVITNQIAQWVETQRITYLKTFRTY